MLSQEQFSAYLQQLPAQEQLRDRAEAAWEQAQEFIALARSGDKRRWLEPLSSQPGSGRCALQELFAGNLQFKVRSFALHDSELERICAHAGEIIAPLQDIACSPGLCPQHYERLGDAVNRLRDPDRTRQIYTENCKVAATLQPQVLVLILPKEKLFAVYAWLLEHIGMPAEPERTVRRDWYQCSYILRRYLAERAGEQGLPAPGVFSPVYALRLREDITSRDGAPLLEHGRTRDEMFVARLQRQLQASRSLILYGAPGTGKSYYAQQVTRGGTVFVTTFHPGYDYGDFVGAYQPASATDETGRQVITYSFVPQIFISAYLEAWAQWLEHLEHLAAGRRDCPAGYVYLDIEEINRGNCALIFGDIFQLLDRDAEGYSRYRIDAGHDCAAYLERRLREVLGGRAAAYQEVCRRLDQRHGQAGRDGAPFRFGCLRLPPNLCLLATMNTSDQSLFPMDSAFKRRWEWEYIAISYRRVNEVSVVVDGRSYLWSDFLHSVNERIRDLTLSEDKLLGPYFVAAGRDNIISFEALRSKVFFYLWDEIYRHETDSAESIFRYRAPSRAGTDPARGMDETASGTETAGGTEAAEAGEEAGIAFSRLFDPDGEQVMAYILTAQLGLCEPE